MPLLAQQLFSALYFLEQQDGQREHPDIPNRPLAKTMAQRPFFTDFDIGFKKIPIVFLLLYLEFHGNDCFYFSTRPH